MQITSTTEHNLGMQGFSEITHDSEKWLRLTPFLSTLMILTGTALAAPKVLWLFSLISLIGAVSDHHLFDAVYEILVRPFTNTGPLPVNPRPRRFAMLVAGVWSSITGLLFALEFVTAGYIVGGLLVIAGSLVATTHFCLGSWMYRMIERQKHEHQI